MSDKRVYRPRARATARAPRATARSPRKPRVSLKGAGGAPKRTLMGTALRAGGGALGSYFGPVGAALGGKLGGAISKILGSGDYVVMGPGGEGVASGAMNRLSDHDQLPTFDYDQNGVVITHREYIGDIYSASTPNTFTINSYPINPGMRQTFPWLSDLVGNSYQQYIFESCVFMFKTFSADALNSVNTALGTVVSCINYDSSDVPYTSRAQMENTDWAVSTKPSESVMIPVECRKSSVTQNNYYIRTGAPPVNSDIKTYDLGRLSIATLNFQGANVNAGSLYVTYKIRLMKPIQLAPLSLALSARYDLNPTFTATHTLGVLPPVQQFDNLGLTFTDTSHSGTKVTFPPLPTGSLWEIQVLYDFGSVMPGVSPGVIASAIGDDWKSVNYYDTSVGHTLSLPDPSGASTKLLMSSVFEYAGTTTNKAPSIYVSPAGLNWDNPSGPARAQFMVNQLNSQIVSALP